MEQVKTQSDGASRSETVSAAQHQGQTRALSPEAQRALAEADARRRDAEAAAALPRELHGRGGAEPVRFGDWEIKGLAVDF